MKCGKQESWHEAAEELRTKLSRYAAKARFNEEFEEAFAFFFGEGPDEMQDELEPTSFSRFMEWFLHDYRLSNGHRLIELFEMEFATELPARMRHLLSEWQKSSLTLLEVLEICGETAQVRDLLVGGELCVRLPPPANTQGTAGGGRLLIGRPVRVGELWEMPGGATILPMRLRERLLQLIRGEFRRFRRSQGGSWYEFLHEQGFVFNDLVDNLSDELETDSEAASLCVRVVYDIVDMQGCMRALRGTVDSARICQRRGETGLTTQVQEWPGMPGELRLTAGRLEVTCPSPEQVSSVKQSVTKRLGSTVRHRLDVFERRRDVPNREPSTPTAVLETAATTDPGTGTRPGASSGGALGREQQRLHLDDSRPAASRQPEWHTEEQRQVAEWFSKVLTQTGVSQEHLDAAQWIWADFCSSEHPKVRQPAAWAAAVHVALGRVEGWRLRSSALARVYGARPSSVSRNAALIAAALDVRQFDDRYCVEHPVDGLLRRLGAVSGDDRPQQAAELLGAGISTVPAEQTVLLARLVRLRCVVANYARALGGLSGRAHELFFGAVGCSPEDTFWQDCFGDWLHFDWPVPVRGGLTVLEEALAGGTLDPADAAELSRWRGCHPDFYVVESTDPRSGSTAAQLVLRSLYGDGLVEVVWPLAASSLKRNDLILTRLVPVDGVLTSVGHALHFSSSLASAIRLRLEEERALLDHWNGRRLKWEEISARYAERLYAIAYRAARGFPDES